MHIEIPEKDFTQLSEAHETALICTYLLDLMENNEFVFTDSDYDQWTEESARCFLLKQQLAALREIQTVLEAADWVS